MAPEVATMTTFGDGNEPTDHDLYGNPGTGPGAEYPQALPVLSASPFYLPNLIAAIVAGIGIVVGSVGTWAGATTVGLNVSMGGLDIQPWGLITLILGGAAAI